jgi:alkylation response protein AidB-like acyl-CoA dehydrogenase
VVAVSLLLAHETTLWRVVAEEEAGIANPAPTASILKVRGTELIQSLGALMVEALGDDALPAYPEEDYLFAPPIDAPGTPLAPGVTADFFYRRSTTIYGGTNEVQRNIIAAELLRR